MYIFPNICKSKQGPPLNPEESWWAIAGVSKEWAEEEGISSPLCNLHTWFDKAPGVAFFLGVWHFFSAVSKAMTFKYPVILVQLFSPVWEGQVWFPYTSGAELEQCESKYYTVAKRPLFCSFAVLRYFKSMKCILLYVTVRCIFKTPYHTILKLS